MKHSLLSLVLCLGIVGSLGSQSHNWNSPSEVVKKVKKKYTEMKSMTADFKILTTNGKKTSSLKGTSQYKNPGKIRYDFTQPDGDAIVSNGKTLWIYIKKIGAAGIQAMDIQKKNSNNEPIFQPGSPTGLSRMFRKYHYKFDSTTQPQKLEDGNSYFVLALEQREKIGGFETMTLYIDSNDYLIKKAIGRDARGKETTIEYSKIVLDSEIQDGVFNYQISGNAKIVQNPLVSAPTPQPESKE
ncbi:MAG: outer membrane lipoprotein carrier protein LolA [Leptospiraceae bacterium]|nr:outer membrane lipoprotein carrier protein LolA [Leptospiraceae bacterium]